MSTRYRTHDSAEVTPCDRQDNGGQIHALPARTASTREDRWGAMMARAQLGDDRAYHRLLLELRGWLRHYYARRLPRDLIEDAVQEALMATYAKGHTYEPSRPFGPWISAIARYKWIDLLRDSSRYKSVELRHDLPMADHSSAVVSSVLVEALLQRLNPRQAEAIRVTKLEGETVRCAATRMGQSEAVTKVNVHRAIRKLATFVN